MITWLSLWVFFGLCAAMAFFVANNPLAGLMLLAATALALAAAVYWIRWRRSQERP